MAEPIREVMAGNRRLTPPADRRRPTTSAPPAPTGPPTQPP